MKPAQSFTEHRVRVLGLDQVVSFTNRYHASEFLLPWAYMDPDVESCEWSGPTWHYVANGRKRKASVPLTVTRRHTGAVEYWDAGDDRRGIPTSADVKSAHASAEGRGYVFFGVGFRHENYVEFLNRKTGYFMLVKAPSDKLKTVETEVLVSLGRSCATLGELTSRIEMPEREVATAVVSLWRQGRVRVPSRTELLGNSWMVRSAHHVG